MHYSSVGLQIKLAEAVERYPCLYNFRLKDYNSRDKVQQAWETVAKEMESSVQECRENWRKMRIVFTRNMKKASSGTKSKKKKPWAVLQHMVFLKPYVTVRRQGLPENVPSPLSMHLVKTEYSADIETRKHDDPDNSCNPNSVVTAPIESLNQNSKSQEPVTLWENREIVNVLGPPQQKTKIFKPSETDDVVINYIKSNTQNTNENNPRRQFLLSLLPDLDDMTATQFRHFRVQVVKFIDRILVLTQTPTSSLCYSNSWLGDSTSSSFSDHQPQFGIPDTSQTGDPIYHEPPSFSNKKL